MESVLEKLSSYNIFNNLLPGVMFVIFAKQFTNINLVQEDVFIAAFLYYFIGLIISRVGSLVLEPLLIKIGLIKYASYEKYVAISAKDPKLDILNETNNMFRTMATLFIFILGAKVYDQIISSYPKLESIQFYFWSISLFLLFLFSYWKQSKYITKRINS